MIPQYSNLLYEPDTLRRLHGLAFVCVHPIGSPDSSFVSLSRRDIKVLLALGLRALPALLGKALDTTLTPPHGR